MFNKLSASVQAFSIKIILPTKSTPSQAVLELRYSSKKYIIGPFSKIESKYTSQKKEVT